MTDLTGIIGGGAVLALLGAIAVTALRISAKKFAQPSPIDAAPDDAVSAIELLLPQTQCGECGYPGCRPYAEAIAAGAAINRCPPGGDTTILTLAEHLGVRPLPLDGVRKLASVAYIREDECIGCTKCIQACPVDAIVGAAKLMHTVIADECTGCDLCVEPCPVDCIEMRPLGTARQREREALPTRQHYRARFHAHTERLRRDAEHQERRRQERKAALQAKAAMPQATAPAPAAPKNKQDEIRAAIARAKAKKAGGANDQRN